VRYCKSVLKTSMALSNLPFEMGQERGEERRRRVEISKPRIDLKKRKTLSTGTVVEIEDEINVVLLR
jgi:hypothetical protein